MTMVIVVVVVVVGSLPRTEPSKNFMSDNFDNLPEDEQRLILERLADTTAYYRSEKRRVEFEFKLFHSHPPVVQEGFCLN